jgi:predicted lactoylglutathione lyase
MAIKKLGQKSWFAVGVANIDKALAYYHNIGFKTIEIVSSPYKQAQISDECLVILLQERGFDYFELVYFEPNLENKVKMMERSGFVFYHKIFNKKGEMVQAAFSSPDNVCLSMVSQEPLKMYLPQQKRRTELLEQTQVDIDKLPNRVLGIYGEFCQPVKDLETSIGFWKRLGYQLVERIESPYPWAVLDNHCQTVGLHQTRDFDASGLLYYTPEILELKNSLIKKGIKTLTEFIEKQHENNSFSVTSPDNHTIFVFNIL